MKTIIILLLLQFSLFAQERPNIIFFFIDDLGYRDLGCYGSPLYQTPAIDSLAKDGKKFTSAYVTAAVCSPSRAAVLTGRHNMELGIWNASHRFESQVLIFPKILSDNGYQTWHLGKWHVGKKQYKTTHMDLGFNVGMAGEESWDPGSHFYPYRHPSAKYANHPGLNVPDLRTGGVEGEYLADRLTDEAVKLIRKRDTAKPFFLNLWHYGVHSPFEAKQDKIAKYEKIMKEMKFKKEFNRDPISKAKYHLSPQSAVYAAMIESIDDSVGKIIKELKDQKIYDNTFIIFYSDNGPVAVTNVEPFRGYKNSLYEGGVRVPAIFSWPAKIKPSVSGERVWTLDIFSTVLELAEVNVKDHYDGEGVSLLPHLIDGEKVPKRDFYWYFPEDRLSWGQRASTVILDKKDMKYHLFFGDYEPELFDLKTDRSESENLIQSHPEIAKELHKKITSKVRANYNILPPPLREFAHLKENIEVKIGN
jgi:arylsulfatase A-like enzyme